MSEFAPGDVVRVSARVPRGHARVPAYVRGRYGVIERACGAFHDPGELAYGRRHGAPVRLYRVRFAARDLWEPSSGDDDDSVDVDLYEHWLEAAS